MSDAAAVLVAGLVLVVLATTGVVVVDSLGEQAEPENEGLSDGQESMNDGLAAFTDLMGTVLVVLMVPVILAAVGRLSVV